MSDLALPGANLALLDEFEKHLAEVTDAAEAEHLWRLVTSVEIAGRMMRLQSEEALRFGKLKLRAERRWGQLLGTAENHGPATTVSGAHGMKERTARKVARQVAAVPAAVFEDYVEKAKDSETLRRARLLRVAREKVADELRAEPAEPVTQHGAIEVRHGDFRDALADVTEVAAIITDPPYPAEYLGEFDALGQFAARALAADGILAVMVGQTHLPEYLRRLSAHIPYRWCGAYLMDGPAARIHGRKVASKWKPVLIFGGSRFIVQDVFSSAGSDKGHHEWGQSESGMADIVSRLTEPAELVVDPFLGGGTTAIVCRDLARNFIGCDLDAAAVAATRERLAE